MFLLVLCLLIILLVAGLILLGMTSPADGNTKTTSLSMNIVISGIRKKFSSVTSISTSELQDAVTKKSVGENTREHLILDVREKNEFEVSHLTDSLWIDESLPPNEKVEIVEKIFSEKPAKPTDVYVYCSVGYRSSALVENLLLSPKLKALRDTNFYNITGGIFQWANENRVVITGDKGEKTELVHPYNSFFGKLLQKSHRYKIIKP